MSCRRPEDAGPQTEPAGGPSGPSPGPRAPPGESRAPAVPTGTTRSSGVCARASRCLPPRRRRLGRLCPRSSSASACSSKCARRGPRGASVWAEGVPRPGPPARAHPAGVRPAAVTGRRPRLCASVHGTLLSPRPGGRGGGGPLADPVDEVSWSPEPETLSLYMAKETWQVWSGDGPWAGESPWVIRGGDQCPRKRDGGGSRSEGCGDNAGPQPGNAGAPAAARGRERAVLWNRQKGRSPADPF